MTQTDETNSTSSPVLGWKYLIYGMITYYFGMCTLFPPNGGDRWYLINTIDLIFHEAGHTLTPEFIFGTFLHVLAGSVYQVAIPVICALYFYMKRELSSVAIMLMWVSASIAYVSIYMGDAQKQILPLLGEGYVSHDWHYLLSTMHVLPYTELLAKGAYSIAIGIFIGGTLLLFKQLSHPNQETDQTSL